MFIPYTDQDLKLQTVAGERWWVYDKIIGFHRQRSPVAYAIRQVVNHRGDRMDSVPANATLKHYIPWIRIFRALTNNLLTGYDGGGMTRQGSVLYLKDVMKKLNIDYKTLAEPDLKASDDRASYEKWISWAMDTICDWPENLFQGPSGGDAGGRSIDVPKVEQHSPATVLMLGEAQKALAVAIKGLSVAHEIGDAPPVIYEEYIPGEDEWYLA